MDRRKKHTRKSGAWLLPKITVKVMKKEHKKCVDRVLLGCTSGGIRSLIVGDVEIEYPQKGYYWSWLLGYDMNQPTGM